MDTEAILTRARRALATGDLIRARAQVQRVGAGRPRVARLLTAVDALMALEALEGRPTALFATADHAARACEAGPGTLRACATTVRVLARLAIADWLASRRQKAGVEQALRRLAEAQEMARTCPVAGIDVVTARVEAAARRLSGGKPRPLRPRAKAALRTARSWRRGTLSAKELVALTRGLRRPELAEMARSMDDYDGDALYWDGDLVVAGDLRVADVDAAVLVISGDLVVSGLYDAPDEHSFVVVRGDLRAADMITASSLDVFGDVAVTGIVLGDYNDGGAHIRGDLRARLFAPCDHPFRVDGTVDAPFILARGEPRRQENRWEALPLAADLRLDDVCPRLRRGLPVLRPA